MIINNLSLGKIKYINIVCDKTYWEKTHITSCSDKSYGIPPIKIYAESLYWSCQEPDRFISFLISNSFILLISLTTLIIKEIYINIITN